MTKLWKLFSLLLLVILPLTSCFSSTSNVTATITGTDGQTWNNGTYTISFWPTPGKPLSQFNVSGATFPQGPFTGSLSAGGVLTITLTDNLTINPAGSKWQFTICPNASSQCFTTQVVVTGAAPNLSATLSAFAISPVVNATPMARAYLDSQVVTPTNIGNMYYDVNNATSKWWNGSSWIAIANGTAPVVKNTVHLTGQSGNIVATDLLAAGDVLAGTYRISFDIVVTTAGTGVAITPTIKWTNIAGIAKSVNPCGLAINGNTLGAECGAVTNVQHITLMPQTGVAITYEVNTASTAEYAIDIVIEKIR